jgi:hypothetical protein
MDYEGKIERGRQRLRSLKQNKDKKRRTVSESGRLEVGNGIGRFCSWCRPKLHNRLVKRQLDKVYLTEELQVFQQVPKQVPKQVAKQVAKQVPKQVAKQVPEEMLIAIMPWTGYNGEDTLIFKKESINTGLKI